MCWGWDRSSEGGGEGDMGCWCNRSTVRTGTESPDVGTQGCASTLTTTLRGGGCVAVASSCSVKGLALSKTSTGSTKLGNDATVLMNF